MSSQMLVTIRIDAEVIEKTRSYSSLRAKCLNRSMPQDVYKMETEREHDGRWIAEVLDLPDVMAYGTTENEAVVAAQVLALRVLGEDA